MTQVLRTLATLALLGAIPAPTTAQQSTSTATSLVFDGATVVDVEHGTLLPARRIVIVGNRIQAIGTANAMKLPKGAHVIDARGKYLMPGLWDMHSHVYRYFDAFLPLLIANGVTGIRDPAGGFVDFDATLRWRREILAGRRVGPRALVTDRILELPSTGMFVVADSDTLMPEDGDDWSARWKVEGGTAGGVVVVAVPHTPAEGRSFVDSMKAFGADFAKLHAGAMPRAMYFAILDEARRVGIPVIGHLPKHVTLLEASDSGQRTIEHVFLLHVLHHFEGTCDGNGASDAKCAALAAHLRRNNTWLVPTLARHCYPTSASNDDPLPSRPIYSHLPYLPETWRSASGADPAECDSLRPIIGMMQRADMPILAGTDAYIPPGFSLHEEFSVLVADGFTPLQALQAATLNPAKYLNATDSLGTVAAGKLADLVLLDANPLENIHNTAAIRAVVANGRYFDRAALDALLADVRQRVAALQADP